MSRVMTSASVLVQGGGALWPQHSGWHQP